MEFLFAVGAIDPDQVIQDAQAYVDKYYGKESDVDMSELKKHLEALKGALALKKITPEQKLGILLKLSKVSTLAYKK